MDAQVGMPPKKGGVRKIVVLYVDRFPYSGDKATMYYVLIVDRKLSLQFQVAQANIYDVKRKWGKGSEMCIQCRATLN